MFVFSRFRAKTSRLSLLRPRPWPRPPPWPRPSSPPRPRRVTNVCHMTVTPNGVGRVELAAARGRRCAEPSASAAGASGGAPRCRPPSSRSSSTRSTGSFPRPGTPATTVSSGNRYRGRPPPLTRTSAPSSLPPSAACSAAARAAAGPLGAAPLGLSRTAGLGFRPPPRRGSPRGAEVPRAP